MIRSGVARCLAGIVVAASVACDDPTQPGECTPPSIIRFSVEPLPHNVLAASVSTESAFADSVVVRFSLGGDPRVETTPAFDARHSVLTVPVLGLQPEAQYTASLVAYNGCGSATSETRQFTTGSLPTDLPRYTASGDNPAPGYVAFAAGNYGIVIENSGRVAWYHRFPDGPGLNFQPQPNGRYAARPTPSFGSQAEWIEIDPLGRVTRTLACADALNARLHDMIALPDSSYWLMCDETRAVDLSKFGMSTLSLVTGTAVQRRAHDGKVLFRWSPFDHLEVDPTVLEPGDLTAPAINWTHGNAIDLDKSGNLLISFRNLNEITSINTSTGAVRWRLGGASSHFTFAGGESRAFARQHAVRSLGPGHLQLLDNLGDPAASRAERYTYDEASRTVRLEASYAPASRVVALTGGTAQPLLGGRMLVSFGSGGKVEEVDAAGTVMWRIDGNPGYVFRAQRIRSLYTPGKGDPR